MTRLFVELHSSSYATVYRTPSLVERLIGRRTTERTAIRVGAAWTWVDGTPVTGRAARLLTEAMRNRIVARATAPPS